MPIFSARLVGPKYSGREVIEPVAQNLPYPMPETMERRTVPGVPAAITREFAWAPSRESEPSVSTLLMPAETTVAPLKTAHVGSLLIPSGEIRSGEVVLGPSDAAICAGPPPAPSGAVGTGGMILAAVGLIAAGVVLYRVLK